MPIDDHDLPGIPPHAGFGPVLDFGLPPSVARGRSPLTVPLSTRAGALAAGIALAVAVLALPAGALALAVAQIKPALAARNAHATGEHRDDSNDSRAHIDGPTHGFVPESAVQGTLR